MFWYVVRFGAGGLSGSSLFIPRDKGKVCLHPPSPDPISSFAIYGIYWVRLID
ncbi:hypothetical protein Hanom_Chr12g01131661 [Helianthus anomalus]